MLCSHSHLLTAKRQERMVTQREKKSENVSCLQILARGHTFLTYSTMADGNDYDNGKKGENFLQ